MRAMDCKDPGTHDDMHFTADSDEDLFGKIQQHRDEYHQDLSDDDIRQLVATNAYDEEPA